MKVTAVRVLRLSGTMPTDAPFWEERLVRPIDIYPEYRRRDDFEGGSQIDATHFRLEQHFVRIETDEGPLALDPFSEGRVVLPSELSRRALRTGLMPDVAAKLDVLMSPISDRAVLIRLQNNIFARAQQARDWARAERSALRRALLDPTDHHPWLDVAAAREGQGALAGALQALSRAQILDGGAAIAARAARERMRLRLN